MSDLQDITAGIKTVLEAANDALRVYTEPPPSPMQYPALVVEPRIQDVDYDLTLGDNTWSFVVPLTLTVIHGQANEGWNELKKYLSPTGTESIKAGIRTDTTLNGAVDESIITGVVAESIGRDPDGEGGKFLFGAQFLLRVWETVT